MSSSSPYSTPISRRVLANKRSLLNQNSPVGRVLVAEGITPSPSPHHRRRSSSNKLIRTKSIAERIREWPANVVLALEMKWDDSLESLDGLGYPVAILLHVMHLMTRLSIFTAALPSFKRAARLSDVDARLEALRKATAGSSGALWAWGSIFSIIFILISIGNAAYVITRRRSYQLVFQTDPLASPNAHSSTLNFSSPRAPRSITQRLKRKIWSLISRSQDEDEEEEGEGVYRIQKLDIWTPEYVLFSLRLFSLYPPPLAIMYHFLTLSNFFIFILVGGLLLLQTLILVRLYTTLLSDRATLQKEVMREYNMKFVNPSIFKQKSNASTMTDMTITTEYPHRRRGSEYSEEQVGEEEEEGRQIVRGSGRKKARVSSVRGLR